MHKSGRAVKQHDIFLVDDRMICKYLADLTLYNYVPSLTPLKAGVLKLTAKIAKLRDTARGILTESVRKDYDVLIRRLHHLFKPNDYDALREFLLKRKWIAAKSIVFADSPY